MNRGTKFLKLARTRALQRSRESKVEDEAAAASAPCIGARILCGWRSRGARAAPDAPRVMPHPSSTTSCRLRKDALDKKRSTRLMLLLTRARSPIRPVPGWSWAAMRKAPGPAVCQPATTGDLTCEPRHHLVFIMPLSFVHATCHIYRWAATLTMHLVSRLRKIHGPPSPHMENDLRSAGLPPH